MPILNNGFRRLSTFEQLQVEQPKYFFSGSNKNLPDLTQKCITFVEKQKQKQKNQTNKQTKSKNNNKNRNYKVVPQFIH